METSDSEDCFESADEDFLSEGESLQVVKPAVRKLPKEKPTVSGDNGNNLSNVALTEASNTVQASSENPVESVNDRISRNRAISQKRGFAKPPTRTECWFPGVNNVKLDNQHKEETNTKSSDSIAVKDNGLETSQLITDNNYTNNFQSNTTEDVITQVESNANNSRDTNAAHDNTIEHRIEEKMRVHMQEEDISLNIKKSLELNIEEQNVLENDGWDNWDEDVHEKLDINNTSQSDICENKRSNSVNAGTKLDMCSSANKISKMPIESVDNSDLWAEDDWGTDDFNSVDTPKSLDNLVQKGDQVVKDNIKREINTSKVISQHIHEQHDTSSNNNESNNDLWGDDEGWAMETDNEIQNKDCEESLWNDNENWSNEQSCTTNISKNLTDINKPQDLTRPFDNIINNQSAADNAWGNWGNWGKSVLSTAANLTNQVSQGLNTVIGIPDPEELAKQHKAEKELLGYVEPVEPDEVNQDNSFGLGNFVSISKITKLVENTGTKVISGGLDTLETIGKKTMQVLQENDPGLKKKRAFLKIDQDRPVLSQILREAKEKAEEENKVLQKPKQINYEMIFDDFQGLVHLEALELLSKQCDIKLQTELSKNSDALELQETMDQIKELCELQDVDDEEEIGDDISDIKDRIAALLEELNVPVNYKNLFKTIEENDEWISTIKYNEINENQVHHRGIETLASITALIVEQFHKIGELLLIKSHRSTADEADSLVQYVHGIIGMTSSKYSEILNNFATQSCKKTTTNDLITNVFFEAANSSRYIEDAFKLLIPVIQIGAI